jgi:hypothetical protein
MEVETSLMRKRKSHYRLCLIQLKDLDPSMRKQTGFISDLTMWWKWKYTQAVILVVGRTAVAHYDDDTGTDV